MIGSHACRTYRLWCFSYVLVLLFPDFPDYQSLKMEPNSHMIPGSQVLQHFPIPSGLNVIGSPIILPSDNASRYPVYPVTQVVASDSCPPCGQGGILTSQDHSMTQVSSYDPRRQRKHNIFTEEQKLVLQEQFNKCMYPDKKQCMTLAQRFGINEYHIKVWTILGLLVF